MVSSLITSLNYKYVVLIIFVLLAGIDLVIDIFASDDFGIDDLIEAVLVSVVGYFSFREVARNRELSQTVKIEQEKNLVLSKKLNDMVQLQFDEWSLTLAEKEIAWLIIRGFAIKEIALLRSVAQKTVHHQLTSVYAKSGARNRAEFTSSFIQLLFEDSSSKTEQQKSERVN